MAAAGWFLALAGALAAVTLLPPRWCAAADATSRPPRSSSLDCGTVTSPLAPCKAFVRRGAPPPAPGAACCEGVAQLYAVAADSADNWRSVCGCMAALATRYSSNASAIALLPVLCGVLPGHHGLDGLTYCGPSS